MADPVVRFEHVTKRFPGAVAIDDVTFEIEAGACHALCGENGAGKSTLGKMLTGIYQPDAGHIIVAGAPVSFASPTDALQAGLAMVHQELAFAENLTVAENLCLGSLPSRATWLSHREMWRRAEAMLAAIDAPVDVHARVGALSIGQQQMLQIAGAVDRGARLIVFDEPTSSLSQHEVDRLYTLIDRLRARGVTSVYVSHRLDEIYRLCTAVTVLRDGRHVATKPIAEIDRQALVSLMIGRPVEEYFPKHAQTTPGPEMLAVRGLSSPAGFRDVSFSVRAGEVVGLAGLVGAGRSQIAHAIFGLDPHATGDIVVNGVPVAKPSPARAIELGIGLVPEDRKKQGLVLSMSVASNATLAILDRLASLTFIKRRAEREMSRQYFSRMRLKASGPDQLAAALSGGNQQKIVLTKWLAANCRILILDEPTRGVDVGAKAEIHALIDELAASGTAIILISSELPEVLNLSTRILVVRDGRVVGEVPRVDATQERVMRLMTGTVAAAS